MYALGSIAETAGQIQTHGLYYIIAALVVLFGGCITLILTGKLRFSRETEVTEKQLEVSNALLASYNEAEVKKTREALDELKEQVTELLEMSEKNIEDNRAMKESLAKLSERQEQYERWNYRNAGGGGNNVGSSARLDYQQNPGAAQG